MTRKARNVRDSHSSPATRMICAVPQRPAQIRNSLDPRHPRASEKQTNYKTGATVIRPRPLQASRESISGSPRFFFIIIQIFHASPAYVTGTVKPCLGRRYLIYIVTYLTPQLMHAAVDSMYISIVLPWILPPVSSARLAPTPSM